MEFIKYCKEPFLFMKIYNTLDQDKKDEFLSRFDSFKSGCFMNTYRVFEPAISFKDGFIMVSNQEEFVFKVDVRDNLRDKIVISSDLVYDLIDELNLSHGLVCRYPSNEMGYYEIDHLETCNLLENLLANR